MTAPLTQLGSKSEIPDSPDSAVIECADWEGSVLAVRFTVPEFTSRCPITGQPDFAHITIDYVPNKHLIESKSLKLFMGSFRDHGSFHEAVCDDIGWKLWNASQPHWMRVSALFYPRGGIPIDVIWMLGQIPPSVHVPDLDMKPYMGR